VDTENIVLYTLNKVKMFDLTTVLCMWFLLYYM